MHEENYKKYQKLKNKNFEIYILSFSRSMKKIEKIIKMMKSECLEIFSLRISEISRGTSNKLERLSKR